MNMNWVNCTESLPEPLEEVLVWIEGHRGPTWRNNYALVAYRSGLDNNFYEERHDGEPLIGVVKWAKIDIPAYFV